MQAKRIIAIVTEIGEIAKNPRIRELATELAAILADHVILTRESIDTLSSIEEAQAAALLRHKDRTTAAIIDTELNVNTLIDSIRADVRAFALQNRQTADTVTAFEERVTQRVHTFANHLSAVEMKVTELAVLVMQMYEHLTIDDTEAQALLAEISSTSLDAPQLEDDQMRANVINDVNVGDDGSSAT